MSQRIESAFLFVKHKVQINALRSFGIDYLMKAVYRLFRWLMEVDFQDKQGLGLVETDRAAETKLSVSLINSLRDKLVVIRAAPDERTLRNWKSLHYEKMKGRGEERSIRLNKQWRLIFTVDTSVSPNRMTIIAVEDPHY